MGGFEKVIRALPFAALMLVMLPASSPARSSGDWSVPPPSIVLSQDILNGVPNDAQVEIDPAGNAIALWKQTDQSSFLDRIYYSVNPAGLSSAWTEPRLVFDQSTALDPALDMAVAPDGTVTAVWTSAPGPGLWEATKPKNSSAFGPAAQISGAGVAGSNPRVTFGPRNEALIVWERENPASNKSIEVYTRQPGKSFFRAKGFVVPDRDLLQPEPAIGPKGEILIVWSRTDPGGGQVIQRAGRAAGKKAWQGPIDMVSPAVGAGSPAVAIEPGGRAVVTYSSATVNGGLLQRTRPAGSSSFESGRLISAAGEEVTGSDTAIGPDGTVAVAWTQGFALPTLHASFRYPDSRDFVRPRLIPVMFPSSPSIAVGGARQIFLATQASPEGFSVPRVTMKPWDSNSFEASIAVVDSPVTNRFTQDIAAGQDGWATALFNQPIAPSGQLEEAAFKTERVGRPKVTWKLNKASGLLVGTITRQAFRNFRYRVSATRGKATAFGKCRTNYSPKRSKATCTVRLSRKGTWKVTVKESQYEIGFETLKKTIRR